ncbi:hypothetical protein DK412_04895 [Methylobacterium sp. 17Sr1-1]|nr:hypothetical protein DK412_04895 [Methylobacterium sp. 17Sr1-1]
MLLPLIILLLGLWERQRGADDWAEFAAEHDRLARVVTDLEARTPRDGRPDYRLQFRHDGRNYGGPLAVAKAREARDGAGTLVTVMDWRRWLPPVAIAGGGIAAGLSFLVLLVGASLGRLGRGSRDALVRGFSLVRRLLPAALGAQILAATVGFVAVVVFEAGLLLQSGLSGDGMKLLGAAIVVVGATILAAGGALIGLRRALGAFEPDPLPILCRLIAPAEAPGLWRLVEGLADRMGALKPEAVVVGLTGGFFVTAGPVMLEPGSTRLSGRILYLPLPHLALMRGDEVAAIISHELAHYAGGDTAYSQRFLPIYAGVARSLDAVAARERHALGLLGPSLRLGRFVMERFHLAVRHGSRVREFAANAAGAGVTSTEAAARALLRSGAVAPRIAETLAAAAEAPDAAPPDLVAAVLARAVACDLDDPALHLEAEQAHPTDTHPPTRERVVALGQALGPVQRHPDDPGRSEGRRCGHHRRQADAVGGDPGAVQCHSQPAQAARHPGSRHGRRGHRYGQEHLRRIHGQDARRHGCGGYLEYPWRGGHQHEQRQPDAAQRGLHHLQVRHRLHRHGERSRQQHQQIGYRHRDDRRAGPAADHRHRIGYAHGGPGQDRVGSLRGGRHRDGQAHGWRHALGGRRHVRSALGPGGSVQRAADPAGSGCPRRRFQRHQPAGRRQPEHRVQREDRRGQVQAGHPGHVALLLRAGHRRVQGQRHGSVGRRYRHPEQRRPHQGR